ncbi:MAG TPA: hypothetical protein VE442_05885 [Jatrophihabitans sp.]|jgi:hypothetical protein|nr:hypothetical protein [Jatrophihabitans sp.]
MAEEHLRPHRPALFADLTEMIDAAGGSSARSRAEVASTTAAVLVQAGRSPGEGARFVALADRVGIDTLAALWQDADPVSLPGSLWALYLLRQWCQSAGEEVTRLWRAGEALAPADAVVAGVAEYADPTAVQQTADAVLTGVYQGDLAVALERAASFFRVVAAGRRCLGEAAQFADDGVDLAERNERVAKSLVTAAGRWRAGTLV